MAETALTDKLKDILDGAGGRPSPMAGIAKDALVGTRLNELLEADSALDTRVTAAEADIDDLEKIVSGTVTIPLGAATVATADLGLGDISGKPVTCSLAQAAEDGTALRFWGEGQADGTLDINANANATADVDVHYILDAR